MKNRREKEEYMRFRPCIDIHNGQVKQIVGRESAGREGEGEGKFCFRAGCGLLCQILQGIKVGGTSFY